MPAVLTHTAIMLLARQRLADVKRVLDARIAARRAAGQRPLLIEARIAALADAAIEIMRAPPHVDATVPGATIASTLSENVSKFAVMGAMGPDIPAFANILEPGQGWLFDTVHKGNPDAHRERVNARTSDLALEIWAQCENLVAEQVVDEGDPERRLREIREIPLRCGRSAPTSWAISAIWRRTSSPIPSSTIWNGISAPMSGGNWTMPTARARTMRWWPSGCTA
jgi:hypothetical protein